MDVATSIYIDPRCRAWDIGFNSRDSGNTGNELGMYREKYSFSIVVGVTGFKLTISMCSLIC